MKAKKIILFETDKSNVEVISNSLAPLYEIILSKEIKNLQAHIIQEQPAIVICSAISYPNESIEIMNELKKEDLFSRLPFVFIISLENKEVLEQLFREQASEILSSPVKKEQLRFRIDSVNQRLELTHKIDNIMSHFDHNIKQKVQGITEEAEKKIISSMVAFLCHEINNPLAIAYMSLGEEIGDLNEKRFQAVKKSLERIKSIIQNMKNFPKKDVYSFEAYDKKTKMLKFEKN